MKLVVKSKGAPHHMIGFIFTDDAQEIDADEGMEAMIRSMPDVLEVLGGMPVPQAVAAEDEDTDPGLLSRLTGKGKKKGK